jgi:hypothetical protein
MSDTTKSPAAPKWSLPQWLRDATANIAIVARAAWMAIPQRGRDVLTGAGFGLVIGAVLPWPWR